MDLKQRSGTGLLGILLYFQSKLHLHHHTKEDNDKRRRYEHLTAQISLSGSGSPKRIEVFGEYVARQIACTRESNVLAKVAFQYLSGDKSASDKSMEGLLLFLNRMCSSEEEMVRLSRELIREFDACLVSYFAFYWSHSALLLDQVQKAREHKLKTAVMAATRKERLERISSKLKIKRTFSTILEMFRAMHIVDRGVPQEGQVVVPADSNVRSPVLLLIGGGMGAGKSTVVKEILSGSFWSSAAHGAVVVEADAFKETDIIYRTISSSKLRDGADIAMASELVHKSSTDAASSLLVAALNEGRDVIFDGTMSWEPFVLQTISMARDVHNRRYRLGRGYVQEDNTEEYWVPDGETVQSGPRLPYRIELVGVTCDPLLAVVRGIRRAIITKRGVPIEGQLRSHRLFAASLEKYCSLVDQARIYSTSKSGEPPELIGWKDGRNKLLIDPTGFETVKQLVGINDKAGSVLELFKDGHEPDVWKSVVLDPERPARQEYIRSMLSSCPELASDSDSSSHRSTSESDSSSHWSTSESDLSFVSDSEFSKAQ